MTFLDARQSRWLVAITVGLILLFFLGAGLGWFTSRTYTLDKLRQEPAVTLVYPGAVNLRHEELEPRSYLLEGLSYGPKIQDIFGSYDSEDAIEAFYTQEMAASGWRLLGVETHNVYTTKELMFLKDRLTAILELWRKESFLRIYPSLSEEAEKYPTLYRVLIWSPPK